MSIRLARESFAQFYQDALPLLRKHAAEIGKFPDIKLDVDVDTYVAMENAGKLRIFAARSDLDIPASATLPHHVERNALVGYAAFFISRHLHYRQSLWAIEDVIYVDPAQRGKMLGARLLHFSETALEAEGVQVVMHHVKVDHPQLGELLARKGYEPSDVLWVKRLDARRQGKSRLTMNDIPLPATADV